MSKHRKTFENAWWASGAEVAEGAPYISRSALKAYLEANMGWSTSTVDAHLRPAGNPGRLIRELLDSGFVGPLQHGWVVIDAVRSSGLLMAKES
jgi:hypothetical protein